MDILDDPKERFSTQNFENMSNKFHEKQSGSLNLSIEESTYKGYSFYKSNLDDSEH